MTTVFEGDGWTSTLIDGVAVHYRLGAGDDGVARITSLFIEADEITTETLRAVSPARLLAATHGKARELALLIGRDPTSDADTTLAQLRARARRPKRAPKRRAVGRPDGTDAFYERFALAYQSAVSESSKPATVLAEENDVPVGTVHRWVKEARRRGHLPPARPGRAG